MNKFSLYFNVTVHFCFPVNKAKTRHGIITESLCEKCSHKPNEFVHLCLLLFQRGILPLHLCLLTVTLDEAVFQKVLIF